MISSSDESSNLSKRTYDKEWYSKLSEIIILVISPLLGRKC